MTPLEKAINEAARAYCKTVWDESFDDLQPMQKFLALELVTALVAPAIKAYEEAKADGPVDTQG